MEQPKEKLKVLSIDDTPSSRRLVQRLLFQRYQFFEAPDGLTGIDEALQVEPDLILVDLHLPLFTGYEFATRLSISAIVYHALSIAPVIQPTLRIELESPAKNKRRSPFKSVGKFFVHISCEYQPEPMPKAYLSLCHAFEIALPV